MSMTQEQINADLFDQCKKLENELANTSDALKAADKEIGFLEQELATLRAKAYDEGQEMMQLAYDANKMSLLVSADNKEVIDIYAKATGYTCRKVRVCEVVG